MKKEKLILSIVLAIGVCGLSGCGSQSNGTNDSITVFNYGMYIDPDILTQFTEETGIEVKYEEATTPEELYTKYISGGINYDCLCTSDYMLERLINEGETQAIDWSTMEYASNIEDTYWDFTKSFDINNEYVMPYFWGTVGILYDSTRVNEPIDSWNVLFNGEYANEIIMQDSMRDIFMIPLKLNGHSLNSENEAELKEAEQMLINQKPDVSAYYVDEVRDELVASNAIMGVIYSGEAIIAQESNPDLEYCIPKEGSNVWIDGWVISKKCVNTEAAKKFLDYLCREDIAMQNFEYVGYSSPNKTVNEALDSESIANYALNPPKEVLDNCEVYVQLSDEALSMYNDCWKEFKAK